MEKELFDNNKNKSSELSAEELAQVSGGKDPEEFGWNTRGMVTAEKDNTPKQGEWAYSAVGTVGDGDLKKLVLTEARNRRFGNLAGDLPGDKTE